MGPAYHKGVPLMVVPGITLDPRLNFLVSPSWPLIGLSAFSQFPGWLAHTASLVVVCLGGKEQLYRGGPPKSSILKSGFPL